MRSGSGGTVVRERVLDAPPEDVWALITEDALLEEWLADRAEVEPWEGGAVRLELTDGEIRDGVVERADAPERLSLWWWSAGEPAGRVEFRLSPEAGGRTRLVVVETRPAVPAAGLRMLARAAASVPVA
jgi:uncharacterized protein YndB with AHSA1/START domain